MFRGPGLLQVGGRGCKAATERLQLGVSSPQSPKFKRFGDKEALKSGAPQEFSLLILSEGPGALALLGDSLHCPLSLSIRELRWALPPLRDVSRAWLVTSLLPKTVSHHVLNVTNTQNVSCRKKFVSRAPAKEVHFLIDHPGLLSPQGWVPW